VNNLRQLQKQHREHFTTGHTHNRGGMWRSHPELIFNNSHFLGPETNDVTSHAHTQNYEEDAASYFLLNPRAFALDWLARYMQC
jgi:hypothetical protein